jgi:hypothetical protein
MSSQVYFSDLENIVLLSSLLLTFIVPYIVGPIYFYSKPNQVHQCLKFILLE